ncbi:Ig kappa chain V-VI region NQ2-6.1 [Tupaia chinensis]|uniref:Ig kappa chain V-VI region NQ2-6.1 n=1 Tax=Tupaia chinensis TaxID=246437 RepID=L8YCZ4_TUPCH|nr:Ig kappa chain V-VI region NQ2-6.1 [Tupaia chinensis]
MALQNSLEAVWLGLFLSPFWKVAESKDQVFQPSTMASSEGAVVEISCNHSVSNAYTFFWYLHFPGCAPRLLVKGTRPAQQGRYNMTYERFSSSLLIHQVQVADAAVYYCALEDTEAGSPQRAEQKQREITTFAGGRKEISNNFSYSLPPNSAFPVPFDSAIWKKIEFTLTLY